MEGSKADYVDCCGVSNVVYVPCVPNYLLDVFLPVYSVSSFLAKASFSCEKSKIPRSRVKQTAWNALEEEKLVSLVHQLGTKKWSKIAKRMNAEFYGCKEVRKGKDCRERWHNHLNPDLNSIGYLESEWTQKEDLIILTQRQKLGNKWSQISKLLKGRTENAVKNRYNSLLRKAKKELPMELCNENMVLDALVTEFQNKKPR